MVSYPRCGYLMVRYGQVWTVSQYRDTTVTKGRRVMLDDRKDFGKRDREAHE